MNGRVLIIEDHEGSRRVLRRRLEQEGIRVEEAGSGEAGIRMAVAFIPQVVLLGTSLPDTSGLQVAQRLRTINRTKHTHLVMVGDQENREERLAGLEAGANDFLTHPIDPELTTLRICNAITRKTQENSTDPIMGLPAGRRVQEELIRLVQNPEGAWALLRFHVLDLEPFREAHGLAEGDDLLRGIARILTEALAGDEIEDDFIGYGGHDDFIVITTPQRCEPLRAEVAAHFNQVIESYYGPQEHSQRYIISDGKQYPLASLRSHAVTPQDGPFFDIRSLSEALAG